MANEFIARRGIISLDGAQITGSLSATGNISSNTLTVTNGITGTATSASYVEYSNVAGKPALVSGSSQISFNGITDKPTLVSGSSQITYSEISSIPSGIVSSSAQVGGYNIFATTGSNTFQANQIITGSLFITQNLVVAGSSSIQYISSSVVDIADNIITVNAFNPGVRFGGLAVADSGSSPRVSGSILFDSIKDQWIFVHESSATTSSVVLMGPETYNDLGNETYLSANRLPKGSGIEHLRDSNITDTGTVVSINSNTSVTGSFTVVTGSAVELQVTNTGVRLGSALTDVHTVTGSLGVTGSLTVAGALNGGSTTLSGELITNNGTNSTNGIKVVSSLSSSLLTGGIEFIRTTVAAGSKIEPVRDAALGGVGLKFMTTANNAAEVSATFTTPLTLSPTGAATFLGPTVTIGNAVAATNVKLILNGVASKAAGIEFHQSGTPQWYIGNGIASEDNNFELYNSNGTMAMKIIKSTNAINFIGATVFNDNFTAGALLTVNDRIFMPGNRPISDWLSSSLSIGYSSTNSYGWVNGAGNLVLGTDGTERMRITSDGIVLIRTTNTGADGLNINNALNLSFSEGSGNAYAVLFRQRNTAATVVASGYKRSSTSGFASSFGTSMARAAIAVGSNNGSIAFFSDSATNVANGTDITPTERMTILNNGNVGISNDSPVTRLTLGGYTGARLPYINGTANTFSGNGITVTSTNSGNAAIGGGLDLTNNTYSVNAYSPIISFSSRSSSGDYNNAYAGIYGVLRGPGGDSNWVVGDIVFATATSYGLTEKMRLITGGFLGIGTDSPEALLHLSQASTGGNGAFIFVDNPASSTLGNTAGIRFATNAGASFSGYGSFIQAVNTNAGNGAEALTFGTWDGASRGERMRINSNGDVGIGLTNPGAILDVSHTAGTTNIIRVSNGAGNYRWRIDQLFSMVMTNASNVDTFSVNTSGAGYFAGNITVDKGITVSSNAFGNYFGKFGAASTSLLELREFTGDQTSTTLILRSSRSDTFYHMQAFNNSSTECFRIESNGNVKNTNSSYGSLSDIKIKENISDATPKLDDLLKVRIRNYNIIGQEVKQIGVIAQELEEIFPSMVDENQDRDNDGNLLETTTKGVKYSVFVPMLIKAIQEQQTQIEILKSENDTLKSILQRNNIS
jgi:hypothetical protein